MAEVRPVLLEGLEWLMARLQDPAMPDTALYGLLLDTHHLAFQTLHQAQRLVPGWFDTLMRSWSSAIKAGGMPSAAAMPDMMA